MCGNGAPAFLYIQNLDCRGNHRSADNRGVSYECGSDGYALSQGTERSGCVHSYILLADSG